MVPTIEAKVDSRQMMEKAIEVMKDSIYESRTDGKISPLVGAVLVRKNGLIETSSRSELRNGDHAEYTLLERKNRDQKLDGSVLFVTLEPCAPNSRNHPKISCAERIVNARITKVWIGIEDPDPKVDTKGIKYLQEHGVEISMFDRDLQEIIYKENERFIRQAQERAVAEEEEKENPRSSKFDDCAENITYDDLDAQALVLYQSLASIPDKIDTKAFQNRLLRMDLLKNSNGNIEPTGYGVLLFGKEPRVKYPQAGLLVTIHYESGNEEIKEFNEALVKIPGELENWLRNKLPVISERSEMVRQSTIQNIPFKLIREVVINALVHRDYDIDGAKCHLIIYPDKLIVKSPGEPVSPITMEQLKRFEAPMLSRNPKLHYIFAQMALAEERGLGMKTLAELPEKYDLPLPIYSFNNPYLELTLYSDNESALLDVGYNPLLLTPDETDRLKYIVQQNSITTKEYMAKFNIDERTAQRQIKEFMEKGYVRKIGAGRTTKYGAINR